jgi:hypothetical protein
MATCEDFEGHLSVYVQALTCWHVRRTGAHSRGTLKRLSSSLVVCLAHLMYPVGLVNPNTGDKPNKPEQQAGSRISRVRSVALTDCFSILPRLRSLDH